MGDYTVPIRDAESDEGATFGPVRRGERHRAQLDSGLDDAAGGSAATDPGDVAPPPETSGSSWMFSPRTPQQIQANRDAIPKKYSPDYDKWHLLDTTEYRALPVNSDQDKAIQDELKVTAAQADEPIVKLERASYEDCARILNGRSIPGILDTLRPVAKDKILKLRNSYMSLELDKKYGCHVLLSAEAILRKGKPLSEKEAFKTEYVLFYKDSDDTKKHYFCDEMSISI